MPPEPFAERIIDIKSICREFNSHRIMEGPGSEKTLKRIQFQPPAGGQGHPGRVTHRDRIIE